MEEVVEVALLVLVTGEMVEVVLLVWVAEVAEVLLSFRR